MKKTLRITLLLVVIILIAAFIYWQQNKDAIIENKISTAVSKSSGELYSIAYDSSSIDALNGNASFYNVILRADSTKEKVSASGKPLNVLYNIQVGKIKISGTNTPGLLLGTRLQASSIELTDPKISINRISNVESFTREDSLELYEKILGKFNIIKAGEIIIKNGSVIFSNKDEIQVQLQGINVSVKNFQVDSTRDYENLVSYFVASTVANVEKVTLKSKGSTIAFLNARYDAPARKITVASFNQIKSGKIVSDLKNISIDGLETQVFIHQQKLIAGTLSSSGGKLTLYNTGSNDKFRLDLDSSFFDEADVRNVTLGNTTVIVVNKQKPEASDMIFKNIRFTARDIPSIKSGSTPKNIIANSNWTLSGDGYSHTTEDKLYKITIGPFDISNRPGSVKIAAFAMKPIVSEQSFVASRKFQQDLYDIQFNNIKLDNADIAALINDEKISGSHLYLEPALKIYSDRTLPADVTSKIGKYPHQQLISMKKQINISSATIKKGSVSYREKGAISKQVGHVFFNNLNGTITNITNDKSVIKNKRDAVLNATAMFMGVSSFKTRWVLPLNTSDGSFSMTGSLGSIDGVALNGALEPLGMASVKRGTVNSFVFQLKGNDLSADIQSTLLYKGLKLEVLKKENDENDLQKKSIISFFANIIIRDENPHDGSTRKNEMNYKRDVTRSFFNLVWKSIFATIKKTITGKSNAN